MIIKIMQKNEKYMLELERVEKAEQQRKDKLGSEQLEKDQLDAQKSFGKREKIIFERKQHLWII